MGVINKMKQLLPATRRSIENVDGKMNEVVAKLNKMSNALEKMDRQITDVGKALQTLQKNTEKNEAQCKNIMATVNALQDNTLRIREEMHNSFVAVKEMKEEVHDNNKRLKKAHTSLIQMTETMDTVKSVVQNGRIGVFDHKRQEKIIVSLTSYPKRISTTATALERIFAQTLKPDKIVLWLSKENFPLQEAELPLELLQLRERGLEIEWCDGDIKSYKKLIPALQKYSKDIVITVDDDLVYELDMIEKLYHSYQKYPKAISAMRTHKIVLEENGEVALYSNWVKDCSEYILEPRMELFATTGAGTLFPPSILDARGMDAEIFMKIAPTADDMWVKGISLLSQTPIVLARENKPLRYIDGTQEETLWGTNMTQNDIQLKNIVEKYDIHISEIIKKTTESM